MDDFFICSVSLGAVEIVYIYWNESLRSVCDFSASQDTYKGKFLKNATVIAINGPVSDNVKR